MSFNGSGTYNLLTPPYPFVANTVIVAVDMNQVLADLAAALSICLTNDGQQTMLANLAMNSFRVTGMSPGLVLGQAVEYDQVYNNPVFTNPSAVADPSPGSDNQTLVTSSWVRDNFTVIQSVQAAMLVYAYQNF